jgi:hypothetical protein
MGNNGKSGYCRHGSVPDGTGKCPTGAACGEYKGRTVCHRNGNADCSGKPATKMEAPTPVDWKQVSTHPVCTLPAARRFRFGAGPKTQETVTGPCRVSSILIDGTICRCGHKEVPSGCPVRNTATKDQQFRRTPNPNAVR